ncbi:MAG: hypothetical protein C5B46_07365 [Proteobacteria bacterium]|nr:MAG: hypothetical protein C5B46_07365 [Pseudomonadota bacterium]
MMVFTGYALLTQLEEYARQVRQWDAAWQSNSLSMLGVVEEAFERARCRVQLSQEVHRTQMAWRDCIDAEKSDRDATAADEWRIPAQTQVQEAAHEELRSRLVYSQLVGLVLLAAEMLVTGSGCWLWYREVA